MGSKTTVQAPAPRDYAKETRDALASQVELAPKIFENEMKYRPQYADLERQIQLQQLGIDPSKGILQAMIEDIVPAQSLMKGMSMGGDIANIKALAPALIDAQRSADPEAEKLRQSIMDRAQAGLEKTSEFDELAEFQKDRLNASMGDFDEVVARAREDLGADPYAEIVEQAREDYVAGEGLTAQERRQLDQQVLEGASARGMADQASTMETMIAERLGANREIGRQRMQDYGDAITNRLGARQLASSQFADAISGRAQHESGLVNDYARAIGNMVEADQTALRNAGSAYQMGNFDVLQAMTGRSGSTPAMAQQGFGSANFSLNSSPGLFNPESSMAQAINAGNYQGELDARTASASNRTSLFGGMLGFGGGLLGGLF